MRNSILTFAAALTLLSCNPPEKHACINPLYPGYTLDDLKDCRVPADFKLADINWEDSCLTMNVFAENVYDMEEVAQMQVGDTLIYEGKPMVVEKLDKKEGEISVNNGLEEGGAWLQPHEGGTWRAVQFDDHSIYTKLGKATVDLASDFMITDCGVNPEDSIIYIKTDQKQYLESLPEYRQSFSCLDTKVLIENGKVIAITRVWIP